MSTVWNPWRKTLEEIVKPGSGILYMKVGMHAGESLTDIVLRKSREIEEAGYALWGYGGNTCHPLSMVQPFATDFERRGSTIYLCMQPMDSSHIAAPARATHQSADGIKWQEIPPAINVLGSRYALAISGLRPDDFEFPLAHTKVALGTSSGRRGDRYVSGRVDKACLEVTEGGDDSDNDAQVAHIGLVATIIRPYAVLLRNQPED
jgi:hypothetical protein